MSEQSIQEQINAAFKTAMQTRDKATLTCIRMVKASMQERLNQPNAPEEADNALWQQIIQAYIKRLDKAAVEFNKGSNAQSATKLAEIEFEKNLLQPYLPKQLDGTELESIIQQAIAQTGAREPRDMGKVMGSIMSSHRGQVDSAQVKNRIQELLKAS